MVFYDALLVDFLFNPIFSIITNLLLQIHVLWSITARCYMSDFTATLTNHNGISVYHRFIPWNYTTSALLQRSLYSMFATINLPYPTITLLSPIYFLFASLFRLLLPAICLVSMSCPKSCWWFFIVFSKVHQPTRPFISIWSRGFRFNNLSFLFSLTSHQDQVIFLASFGCFRFYWFEITWPTFFNFPTLIYCSCLFEDLDTQSIAFGLSSDQN